jgi:hypothetical protein
LGKGELYRLVTFFRTRAVVQNAERGDLVRPTVIPAELDMQFTSTMGYAYPHSSNSAKVLEASRNPAPLLNCDQISTLRDVGPRRSWIGFSAHGIERTRAKGSQFAETGMPGCTKIRHCPVNGLHSVDSAADTDGCFSLTLKLRSVQRQSFFDNVPSFAGWCGVRGSSLVTFLLQGKKEGERGSKAKRWPRRTGTTC